MLNVVGTNDLILVLHPELALTDLNRVSGYDRSLLQEVNDVFRGNGFFSADATSSMVAVTGPGRLLSRNAHAAVKDLVRVAALALIFAGLISPVMGATSSLNNGTIQITVDLAQGGGIVAFHPTGKPQDSVINTYDRGRIRILNIPRRIIRTVRAIPTGQRNWAHSC
jgi:hypothetical protein